MIDLSPRVKRICEVLVPSVPCYVLLPEDSDAIGHLMDGVLAYHLSQNDLQLRPYLEHLGVWCGRGFATVFNRESFLLRDDADRWQTVESIVVHELCHWLTDEATAMQDEQAIASYSLIEEMAYQFAPSEDVKKQRLRKWLEQPQWHFHGADFIRVGCHAYWRLQQAGIVIDWRRMGVAGAAYGLSSFCDYHHSLRDEYDFLANVPLRELVRVLPTTEFVKLFLEDTKNGR
jgi:hypothetical protein